MTVGTYLYSFPFYGCVRIMIPDGADADGTVRYVEACTEYLINTRPTSLDLLAEKEISSACVHVEESLYFGNCAILTIYTK